MKELYRRSDTLIKDWLSDHFTDTDTFKNDPFLSVQKKPNGGLLQSKYIDLMPEPFLGNPDPENNLVVMLNLNPGYGETDAQFIGKKVVSERLANGYSEFAKTNPYLTDPSFHPAAYEWSRKRLIWLRSILDVDENDERLQFVLELCPWHSHKWGEARINNLNAAQIQYINDNVLVPATKAAKQSKAGFIVSVGKIYTKLYPELGFELVKEWEPDEKDSGWPKSRKTSKPKSVHFKYYKKVTGSETVKVLSIWIWGCNKTPCSEFLPLERSIVEYIRNH